MTTKGATHAYYISTTRKFGGGMDLEITSYPNTEITLSNEKVTKRLVSDDDGIAIFKGVKAGAYTATANGKSKQITVADKQKDFLCEQIKDLPLKSKIKFSSGKKFILMAKNPHASSNEPHPLNSACLVSEFVVDTYTMENLETWYESDAWQRKMFACYEELPWVEKETVLPRYVWNDGVSIANQYFYMLSEGEMGVSPSPSVNEYNLGFPDDASRIRTTESGELMGYWLRDQYRDGYTRVNLSAVSGLGENLNSGIGGWTTKEKLPMTGGLVLACDISQDAYVALDDDGYYRILGM